MLTRDLSDFGYLGLKELDELIQAANTQGFPSDFYNEDICPIFNTRSKCVFLQNSEGQSAMLNAGKLETVYILPYSCIEGFLDELIQQFDDGYLDNLEDVEELAQLCIINGKGQKAEELQTYIETAFYRK